MRRTLKTSSPWKVEFLVMKGYTPPKVENETQV
jgi:hypothetical protein